MAVTNTEKSISKETKHKTSATGRANLFTVKFGKQALVLLFKLARSN
jgi:hypothetical protein